MIAAITALLLTSTPFLDTSRSDAWDARDTQVQLAASAICIADVASTSVGLHTRRDFKETNPLLPPRPDQATLWVVGLTGCAVMASVAWLLPRPYREVFQLTTAGIQVAVTAGNVGLIVRF